MAFAISYTYKVIDQASKTLAKIEKQFEKTQAAAKKVSETSYVEKTASKTNGALSNVDSVIAKEKAREQIRTQARVAQMAERANERAAIMAERAQERAAIASEKMAARSRERLAKAEAEMLRRKQRYLDQKKKAEEVSGTDLLARGVALYGLARTFAAPISAAIEFESAMADVKKVVDFPTPQAFSEMERDIKELARTIPITHEGFARIIAEAGQADIPRQELKGFARDAAMVAVAFDISADSAGDMLAKWRTSFKMTQQETMRLVDQVNYLGNTTAAGAVPVANIVTRVGALGEIAHVTQAQLAAMATTLASANVQEEIAATGIKNFLVTLNLGAAASKTQAKAFKSLGLSAVGVAKAMSSDAMGTSLDIIERIKKLPESQKLSVIESLFGRESILPISTLITNTDGLRSNLEKVRNELLYSGSAVKEFEARSKTTENTLILLGNAFREIKINLGSVMLPVVSVAARALAKLSSVVATATEKYPILATLVYSAAGAFIALQAALLIAKAAQFAFNIEVMKNPYVLAAMAIATLVIGLAVLAAKYEEIGNVFREFSTPLKDMSSAIFQMTSPLRDIGIALGIVDEKTESTAGAIKLLATVLRATMTPLYAFFRILSGTAGVISSGFSAESLRNFGNIQTDIASFATGQNIKKIIAEKVLGKEAFGPPSPSLQTPPNAQAPMAAANQNNKSMIDLGISILGNKEVVQGVSVKQVDRGNLGVNAAVRP